MKNNNIKRLTSLLLAFVMFFSTIFTAMPSFADENIEVEGKVEENIVVENDETTIEENNIDDDLIVEEKNEEEALVESEVEEETEEETEEAPEIKTEKTKSKKAVIKLDRNKKQKIDITEYIHEYLETVEEAPTTRMFRGARSGVVTSIDLVVTARYEAIAGSKYNLSDYVQDDMNFDLDAIYIGDNAVGDIGYNDTVTDRLNIKDFMINSKDVYGNGGIEDKDLFPEDITIDGYNTIADYLSTNFSIEWDPSIYKEGPSGSTLDAYLTLAFAQHGNVSVPTIDLKFIEEPTPTGDLGKKTIEKGVLNETEGEVDYLETTKAKPGDKVAYRIQVKNESNMEQKIVATDVLNKNLTDIELVKSGLGTGDEFNLDGDTIKINASIKSGETKDFIYKAVVGEDAFEEIKNIAEMIDLEELTDNLSREDRIKVREAENGEKITVTDASGNEIEVVVYNDTPYKEIKVEDSASLDIEILDYNAEKKAFDKNDVEFTGQSGQVMYPGDEIRYEVIIDNTIGNVKLKEIQFEDILDTNIFENIKAVSSDGTVILENNGILTATIPEIAVGDTVVITITAKIKTTGLESVVDAKNKATITPSNPNVVPKEVETPTIPVEQIEKVEPIKYISKIVDTEGVETIYILNNQPKTVKSGSLITYVIEVENTGNVDLMNVKVKDTLVHELSFVSSDDGLAPESQGSQTVVGTIAEIKVGEKKSVSFVAKLAEKLDAGTKVTNVAEVEGEETPGTETPVAPEPAFKSTKEAYLNDVLLTDKDKVTPNSELKYVIKIENTGNAVLKNIEVEDKLNESVEFISLDAPATITENNGVISGVIDSIGIGETVEIIINVKVKVSGLDKDANAKNIAIISPEDVENPEDPENPTIPVEPQEPETPELPIDQIIASEESKKAYLVENGTEVELTGQMIQPESQIKYIVSIKNTGNVPMIDTEFEDILSKDIIFESATSDDGTIVTNSNGKLTATISNINPGETVNITINAKVKSEAEGLEIGTNVKNTAKVDDKEIVTPEIPVGVTKFDVPDEKIYKTDNYNGLDIGINASLPKDHNISDIRYVLLPINMDDTTAFGYLNRTISGSEFDSLFNASSNDLKGAIWDHNPTNDERLEAELNVKDNYIVLVKTSLTYNGETKVTVGSTYIDNFYTVIEAKHNGIGDASNLSANGGEDNQLIYDYTDENISKVNNDGQEYFGFPLDINGKVLDKKPNGSSGVENGAPKYGYDEVEITSYHKDKFKKDGWDLVLSDKSKDVEKYSAILDAKYNGQNTEVLTEKELKHTFDYIANENLLSKGTAEIQYLDETIKDRYFAHIEIKNADEESKNKMGRVFIFKKGIVDSNTKPVDVMDDSNIIGVFNTDANGVISTKTNDNLANALIREFGGDFYKNAVSRVPIVGTEEDPKFEYPIYVVFQEGDFTTNPAKNTKLLSNLINDEVKEKTMDSYTFMEIRKVDYMGVTLVAEKGAKLNIVDGRTGKLISKKDIVATGKSQNIYYNDDLKRGDRIQITAEIEGKRVTISNQNIR